MRAKLASFISVITLSISMSFIAASVMLLLLSHKIENSWKNAIKVNVFISDSVSTNQLYGIKEKLLKINDVKSAKYYSKEEAYKKFVEITGEDFKKILETNPLPRSYTLTFRESINQQKIDKIIKQIKNIAGIEDVIYDYNLTFTILEYINSMKIFIFILTFLFLIVSFYLLYSTSRLIISQKMEQYNTMKLVGAKLSTIKMPLLFTGIILGIISAILCSVSFDIVLYILKRFYPQFIFENYIYFGNFAFILLGMLLGPLGIGFYTKKLSLKIEKFN
jgi:cell division transport system permease protein